MKKNLAEAAPAQSAQATIASAPKRRGRKPITDPLHLTPCERNFLVWLSENGSEAEGVSITKAVIAEQMGLNVKTIDHSVSRLRRRGMVEVVPCYTESGGQVSNVYRVTLLAHHTYPELFK